ncbi:MAG: hypothetical protein JSU87_15880 [Gemmatimonadota bacterium]|nr:MAG: hypothetical protein JSU87_15880 [Gemmatimonadota bacterium]
MTLRTMLTTLLILALTTGGRCLEESTAPQEGEGPGQAPAPPTLSNAVLRSPEPICSRPSTIVCEDFETSGASDWNDYKDNNFNVQSDDAFGGERSLRQRYDLGQVGAGWLAWFFGDHPNGGVRGGERFEEVYFRFYHKFQPGWPDSYPPKVARIRSHFIDGGWRFAWAEHLWISRSRSRGTPASDPMSRIAAPDGTEYLDDAERRWLGNKPLDLRFAERDGEWVAIEMRVKLNTPGQDDGEITYWADGKVVLQREGLNIRGAYTATTINVAMLDTYWNGGAVEEGLKRWYDNVVVATEPIGCAGFSVSKSGLERQGAWQLQIAAAADESSLVWDSGTIQGAGDEVVVSESTGTFSGGRRCVYPSEAPFMRARQAVGSSWSEWSDWAPMF